MTIILRRFRNNWLWLFLLIFTNQAFAEQSVPAEIAAYMDRISAINLLDEKEQEVPYKQLLAEAETYLQSHEGQAEAWVVTAMSRASYARSQGMSALGLMKKVRKELETAIDLNPRVMNGYANSFLGRLYFLLPAWPISYGSDKKARHYIEESLATNDQSMENHFAYGWYWSHEKQYDKAKLHLQQAKNLPSVISNANWVNYIQKQIDDLLEYVDKELSQGE